MLSKTKATATTDHEEIRRWADERGATSAWVRNTGGNGDAGILGLDFPGYSGEESLEPLGWNEWFEKFEQQGLALLHQETTAGGEKSNFNKLVSREKVGAAEPKSAKSEAPAHTKASSTDKAAAQSKAQSRNAKRSAEGKTAQKHKTITNVSRKHEAAKPSPHTRPTRGRAA